MKDTSLGKNFQMARDIAELEGNINELTRTLRALRAQHREAYYVQKEQIWRCPDCRKTARTAPNLTKKPCTGRGKHYR